MFIRQISIFAENRNGAIMEITKALGNAGINIRALSIADTTDFGIVRLIVDKTDKAIAALKAQDMTLSETPVIAVSIADTPGAFNGALEALYDGAVMIEYSYGFVSPVKGGATVILRCSEPEKAYELIRSKGLCLLTQDDVSA